ncbi:MAG: ABC transporter substrate-binding protein [Elusimicrobia bacterium]|nr:ABC transporter substrate-binding protein [Elusimicrobiota bacterium]
MRFSIVSLVFAALPLAAPGPCRGEDAVKLAYFHGGKTAVLLRAYVNGSFEAAGVRLELHSKYMGKPGFELLPRSTSAVAAIALDQDGRKTYFGKASGIETAEAALAGDFDGATMGEASFLLAVSSGAPLVAVATLSHDVREAPSKAIVVREDVMIDKPEDFKGKTLISRRAGPGEAVMLREFVLSIGLAPGKDVELRNQVPEDEMVSLLRHRKVHGGLYDLSVVAKLVQRGQARLYRRMDWMNPEVSQALLVFRKDFVESRPEAVRRVLAAYAQRIRAEKPLAVEQVGLDKAARDEGLGPPRADDPPWVRADLLEEYQDLLIKHGVLGARVPLDGFVDTALLKKALEIR